MRSGAWRTNRNAGEGCGFRHLTWTGVSEGLSRFFLPLQAAPAGDVEKGHMGGATAKGADGTMPPPTEFMGECIIASHRSRLWELQRAG